MMEKISKVLTWQMVALLVAGGLVFAAIALFAPPDVRELLLGANGLVATVIAYFLRAPNSGPPPPPPPAVMMLGALTLAGIASACGGASDAMRAAYAEEVARCTLNERAIVERDDTTEEEDREALEVERARCDAALRAIEHGGAE